MPQCYPHMRLLDKKPFKRLCELICDDYLNKRTNNLKTWMPETRREEIIKRYILNDRIDEECEDFINEQNDQNLIDKILILRGLLNYDILYLVLSKRWKVQYGVNEASERLWQAVPFRAKDVPAGRAQFAHPDIAIGLTQLSYYYSGLNQQQFYKVISNLEKLTDAFYIYEKWIKSIPQKVKIDDSIKDYTSLNLADTTQIYTLLYPTLKYHQPVIDYWLSNFLYPKEAKEFENRLSMSAWDLCDQNRNLIVGFSGTNDSKILLPLSMNYHALPQLIGTSGKVISNLYCQNDDPQIYNSLEENMDEIGILRKINENSIPVLLDVGALIIRMSNKEVAKEWLKLVVTNDGNNEIEACVFFEGNDLSVIDRNTWHATSFETSTYKENLKKCLIYLDESHCRGTDLRIPPKTKAAVTLGRGLTKDRLVQACMRMRMLGKENGHSVSFYASSEVNNIIISRINEPNCKPNCVDVLQWSIENSLAQIMNDFYYWAIQGLVFTKKNCANLNLNLLNNDSDIGKYFENCKEICQNELNSMFGKNRILKRISEIIKAKIEKNPPMFNENYFKLESNKLVAKIRELIADVKRYSQLLEEEIEMEVEKETEEENELERPPKAEPFENKLSSDVLKFVEFGEFNSKSSVFLSFGESFSKSSLNKFTAENQSWSRNFFVTHDFFETVKTTNQSDDYLASPRWFAVKKDDSNEIVIVLSGFEVNELMHRFNTECHLFMFMPRMRSDQRRFFSDKNDLLLSESVIQELSIFSGSLYFNTYQEQECYLDLIGFVPNPRNDLMQKCFNEKQIELNGFVMPQNRSVVFFGKDKRIMFNIDPAEFIIKLTSIRNYSIVPSSAHHLMILSKGQKPLQTKKQKQNLS